LTLVDSGTTGGSISWADGSASNKIATLLVPNSLAFEEQTSQIHQQPTRGREIIVVKVGTIPTLRSFMCIVGQARSSLVPSVGDRAAP
jgi:hypothetical protein